VSGTTNYVTKFTSATTIGNSSTIDTGIYLSSGIENSGVVFTPTNPNITTAKNWVLGGLGFIYSGYGSTESSSIASNMYLNTTPSYVAKYSSANGFGAFQLTGGTMSWASFGSASVVAGTAYTPTTKFTVDKAGQISFNTYTSTSAYTATTAIGSLAFDISGNILTAPKAFTWTTASSTSITAAVNTGYITGGTLVTITLPAVCAAGDVVEVVQTTATGWTLRPATGDTINFGILTATTSITSATTLKNDAIRVVCTTANSVWTVLSSQGNLTVV